RSWPCWRWISWARTVLRWPPASGRLVWRVPSTVMAKLSPPVPRRASTATSRAAISPSRRGAGLAQAGRGRPSAGWARAWGRARPLGDGGGPPRAVRMMQGAEAGLDVGTHPHLLGRADEHRHPPVPAAGEQLGLGLVVGRFVYEGHRGLGHAPARQLVAQFGVD